MDTVGHEPEQPPVRATDPSTSDPVDAVRGQRGARAVAVLLDAVAVVLLFVIVTVLVPLACSPFMDSQARPGVRLDIDAAMTALEKTVPVWVLWLMAVLFVLGVLVLSGAAGRRGRVSLGLRATELELRTASGLPARWRLALRWLVPVGLFAAISSAGHLPLAGAVVLAGWAVCLVGGRRSLYDLLAGVTVIDPVATDRRADAARRKANPWKPPAD